MMAECVEGPSLSPPRRDIHDKKNDFRRGGWPARA